MLKDNFSLYIGDNKKCVNINSFRPHKDWFLIMLKDYNDIDLVSVYVNEKVYVSRKDLNLDKDEYVMEDFIDKKAYFRNDCLGVIASIDNYGSSNYVMRILGESELLIPYNENFIDSVSDNVYLKNVEVFVDEN